GLDATMPANQLREKPSKRDVAWSRHYLLDTDAKHQLKSRGKFDGRSDYLRIDNTLLSPETVAEQIIMAFGLVRSGSD
ncbi:MAG: shikimate kinase, partial [Dehalococcoidia bacterium]